MAKIVEGDVLAPDVKVLSTGMKVRFKPVNSMTVQRAADSVVLPEVYVQAINQPNGVVKFAQNPNHPDYAKKVEEAEKERSLRSLEAMVFYGVELVDPLPEDDEWLADLGMMMNLDRYYYTDAEGKSKISKKAKVMLYVIHQGAKTPADYQMIAENVMVTEAAVQEQQKAFRDN